jgi:hypothetical protein
MISNQTLLHKHPQTGEPQPIGLGWLDDAMTITGPTEVHCIAVQHETDEIDCWF